LKYVLSVNAVNVVDEVRLLRAIFSRIINFRSLRRLEEYLGKSVIVRHKYGPYFLVGANTSDLFHVALEEDYELKTWFLPYAKGIVVDVNTYIGTYTVFLVRRRRLNGLLYRAFAT
jgi:hypothetical protein